MRKLIASVLLATAGVGPASANLLTNGSFESPSLGGPGYTAHGLGDTSITGWTVVGAGGNVALLSGPFNCCGGPLVAQDGAQFMDLAGTADNGSYSGLEQSVLTTAGTKYRLSFHVGTVAGLTTTIEALADGTSLGNFTGNFGGTSTYAWTLFNIEFEATDGSTAIRLMSKDRDFDVGLDNVSLVAAPSGVPEPAALGLLGVGMLGLALRRRRA